MIFYIHLSLSLHDHMHRYCNIIMTAAIHQPHYTKHSISLRP